MYIHNTYISSTHSTSRTQLIVEKVNYIFCSTESILDYSLYIDVHNHTLWLHLLVLFDEKITIQPLQRVDRQGLYKMLMLMKSS